MALISALTSVIMFSCVLAGSGAGWGCAECCRESETQSCDDEKQLLCVVDHVDYQFGCPGDKTNKLAYVFLGSREKAIDTMLNMADKFETIDLLCMALVFYFGMLITFGLGLPQGIFMPSIMIGVSWGLLFSKVHSQAD